jgi:hypothetical protein
MLFDTESETEISSKRKFLRARGRPLVPEPMPVLRSPSATEEGTPGEDRRHGWWKPVSPGGRSGGVERILRMRAREKIRGRRTARDEDGKRKGEEEGSRKIGGERETARRITVCACACEDVENVRVHLRRTERATMVKRPGRSKTNKGDETTESTRESPERGAPLRRRCRREVRREGETEITTKTRLASSGGASERGAKIGKGRRAE